ncbi:hypothetical protein LP420_00860 [Massilia sp. B-10]|nr:hypothetical protein LP420_00860 [Massilia sp. B-10]
MTQITLVLPFALPPAELAADLIRALKALKPWPSLLSRANAEELPFDPGQRVLPHEAWLSRKLGLSEDGQPAFAAAAMRGLGLDPGTDSWFIVNPAHVEIARSHLSITDLRQLRLSNVHAKELFERPPNRSATKLKQNPDLRRRPHLVHARSRLAHAANGLARRRRRPQSDRLAADRHQRRRIPQAAKRSADAVVRASQQCRPRVSAAWPRSTPSGPGADRART